MKVKKIMAVTTASVLLASTMMLSASAATASFKPTGENFAPLFDFDSTPTSGYKQGYVLKDKRHETIGSGKSKPCIDAQDVGTGYDLTIDKPFKNNGLKLVVNEWAPATGLYSPVSLNCRYGDQGKTLPGVPDGYEATDFVFWINTKGFHEKDDKGNMLKTSYKGIYLYFQEIDCDASGNLLDEKKQTAWQVKSKKDNGCFYTQDGKGGWTKNEMNPYKATAENTTYDTDRSIMVPSGYEGWVKIPLDKFAYAEFCKDNPQDENKKMDCKKIELISLGVGNYESQIGSVLYFDEFGFIMKKVQTDGPSKNDDPKNTTTKPTKDGTKAPDGSEGTDTGVVSDTATGTESSTDTTVELTLNETTKSDKTKPAGPADQKDNNNPTGLIITIIVLVVVLGGAGTGIFFFDKKVKKDGYASIIDYFKKKSSSKE